MLILVLTGTDDPVTLTVGDYVDTPKRLERSLNSIEDGPSRSYLACFAKKVFMRLRGLVVGDLACPTYGHHYIIPGQGKFDKRAAHVTSASKDLAQVSVRNRALH